MNRFPFGGRISNKILTLIILQNRGRRTEGKEGNLLIIWQRKLKGEGRHTCTYVHTYVHSTYAGK